MSPVRPQVSTLLLSVGCVRSKEEDHEERHGVCRSLLLCCGGRYEEGVCAMTV